MGHCLFLFCLNIYLLIVVCTRLGLSDMQYCIVGPNGGKHGENIINGYSSFCENYYYKTMLL